MMDLQKFLLEMVIKEFNFVLVMFKIKHVCFYHYNIKELQTTTVLTFRKHRSDVETQKCILNSRVNYRRITTQPFYFLKCLKLFITIMNHVQFDTVNFKHYQRIVLLLGMITYYSCIFTIEQIITRT